MGDHCPADAPCEARANVAETDDAWITPDDEGDWWLSVMLGSPLLVAHILYCPWCGGRLVETAPIRCHGNDGRCTSTATHGPDGKAIVCWGHAGDWPEVTSPAAEPFGAVEEGVDEEGVDDEEYGESTDEWLERRREDDDERRALRGTSQCDQLCDPTCDWCLAGHDCPDQCGGGDDCPYNMLAKAEETP